MQFQCSMELEVVDILVNVHAGIAFLYLVTATALDLDLAVAHAHIVARSFDGGRAGQNAPIAHTEAGAVPGTLYNIAC